MGRGSNRTSDASASSSAFLTPKGPMLVPPEWRAPPVLLSSLALFAIQTATRRPYVRLSKTAYSKAIKHASILGIVKYAVGQVAASKLTRARNRASEVSASSTDFLLSLRAANHLSRLFEAVAISRVQSTGTGSRVPLVGNIATTCTCTCTHR
jgi:hypothetical protein